MTRPLVRRSVAAALLLVLWGCASTDQLPPPPVHPNGQALWRIVHEQCVPDQREHGVPAPCAKVVIGANDQKGFVVLKDRVGVAQHLLMPMIMITGIEDPKVLAPDAGNFFADGWTASSYVQGRLSKPLPRDLTSVAVNSIYGRSQDLLHLHIDCLDPEVRSALSRDAGRITEHWSEPVFILKGHPYQIRWIGGEKLAVNPFRLLADEVPEAANQMGAWTLALVGAVSPSKGPGFYLIAARADPAKGERASSEELQDHTCRGLEAS